MNSSHLLATLFLLLAFVPLRGGGASETQAPKKAAMAPSHEYASNTDLEVLAAVAEKAFKNPKTMYYVSARTLPMSEDLERENHRQAYSFAMENLKVSKEMRADFEKRNASPACLTPFSEDKRIRLISPEEFDRRRKERGAIGREGEEFARFTLPGYSSAAEEEAAVYLAFIGPGGSGVMYYLKKKDGKWQVTTDHGLWIA